MTDNLPKPRVLLTDRGYDSDNIRKTMEARDVLTQIPIRKSGRMRIGVDHSLYSLRNLVERFFNKLKNARRVATRYEYICKIWTSEPDRFIVNPIHQMLGLNT